MSLRKKGCLLAVALLLASAMQFAHALGEAEADGLLQQIEQQDPAALARLRAEAQQGDAVAQDRLGLCYLIGRGVEKKVNEAKQWLLKSAQQDYPLAQARLGFIYENEAADDPAKIGDAMRWYQKAAAQRNLAAAYNLALLYQEGKAVQKDQAQAKKWFRVAAEQGLAEAQLNLGALQMADKEYAEAHDWLAKAAASGNAKAMLNLGRLHQGGLGVPQSDAAALVWYQKSAEAGEWLAMGVLSDAYRAGQLGLEQDSAQADEWYKKFIAAQIKAKQ